MSIRLNGSTSGYTEIDAPAVAGSNTLVLPTGNGSADQALVTNGSGTLSFADRGRMVQATAQASTSGTSIDFTSIPSWVKRVTVMFNGVSTNGTSSLLCQLGAGSITSTGYTAQVMTPQASAQTLGSTSTSGFVFIGASAANVFYGHLTATLVSGNLWLATYQGVMTTALFGSWGSGAVTLSGALDRVRITTVNGTDAFDAGSINLLLEG